VGTSGFRNVLCIRVEKHCPTFLEVFFAFYFHKSPFKSKAKVKVLKKKIPLAVR